MVITVICLIDEVIKRLKIIVIQKQKSINTLWHATKICQKMLQYYIHTDRTLKLEHYFLALYYKSIHGNDVS